MTGRLKILTKVIQRRVQAGENRDDVLGNYLLTDEEEAVIIAALTPSEGGAAT
ncbi:MAG: hypothetical protein ACQGTM_08225 [bacterium]